MYQSCFSEPLRTSIVSWPYFDKLTQFFSMQMLLYRTVQHAHKHKNAYVQRKLKNTFQCWRDSCRTITLQWTNKDHASAECGVQLYCNMNGERISLVSGGDEVGDDGIMVGGWNSGCRQHLGSETSGYPWGSSGDETLESESRKRGGSEGEICKKLKKQRSLVFAP